MSTLDAEFFYAEHHNVPMHIGSVMHSTGTTRAEVMRLFEAKPAGAPVPPGRRDYRTLRDLPNGPIGPPAY
jgi:hypothetical protein